MLRITSGEYHSVRSMHATKNQPRCRTHFMRSRDRTQHKWRVPFDKNYACYKESRCRTHFMRLQKQNATKARYFYYWYVFSLRCYASQVESTIRYDLCMLQRINQDVVPTSCVLETERNTSGEYHSIRTMHATKNQDVVPTLCVYRNRTQQKRDTFIIGTYLVAMLRITSGEYHSVRSMHATKNQAICHTHFIRLQKKERNKSEILILLVRMSLRCYASQVESTIRYDLCMLQRINQDVVPTSCVLETERNTSGEYHSIRTMHATKNQDVVPTLCVYRNRTQQKRDTFIIGTYLVCDATHHKWRVPFGTIYACYKESSKMSYPLYAFTEKGTQQKSDTYIIGTYEFAMLRITSGEYHSVRSMHATKNQPRCRTHFMRLQKKERNESEILLLLVRISLRCYGSQVESTIRYDLCMLQKINQDVVPTLCVYRKRNTTKARYFYYWYVFSLWYYATRGESYAFTKENATKARYFYYWYVFSLRSYATRGESIIRQNLSILQIRTISQPLYF